MSSPSFSNSGHSSNAGSIKATVSDGLRIFVDLTKFPKNVTFAYIDSDSKRVIAAGNLEHVVTELEGASKAGVIELPEQPPYGWLSGKRICLKLVPDRKAKCFSFLSDADGEFSVELYVLTPKHPPIRVFQANYALM